MVRGVKPRKVYHEVPYVGGGGGTGDVEMYLVQLEVRERFLV